MELILKKVESTKKGQIENSFDYLVEHERIKYGHLVSRSDGSMNASGRASTSISTPDFAAPIVSDPSST